MNIYTLSNLTDLLKKYEIPVDVWKEGRLKKLLSEVIKEESILSIKNGELIREVKALSIVVRYKNFVLKEDRQEFKNGDIRTRKMNASVAEKIDKNDVDLTSAVKRGLKEELGINLSSDQITKGQDVNKVRPSSNFIGLKKHLTLIGFIVELTDDQFDPNGYEEHQEDKSTYFIWKKE